ncbi:MAG: fluoride efflux transporter CrcB [Opitutales bacterium]
MAQFTTLLWVGLGGAGGAMLRAWLGLTFAQPGHFLPWPTLVANVLGSLILGGVLAVEAHSRNLLHPHARDLLAIGFCGGFTTFSTFSWQTLDLLREGKHAAALTNIALNLLLTLGAVALGYFAGRYLLSATSGR